MSVFGAWLASILLKDGTSVTMFLFSRAYADISMAAEWRKTGGSPRCSEKNRSCARSAALSPPEQIGQMSSFLQKVNVWKRVGGIMNIFPYIS